MNDAEVTIGFLRQEVEYWRDRVTRLQGVLSDTQSEFYEHEVPVEPPVGTRFYFGVKGWLVWEHRDTGWFCYRDACTNCPAVWRDIHLNANYPGNTRVLPGEPS